MPRRQGITQYSATGHLSRAAVMILLVCQLPRHDIPRLLGLSVTEPNSLVE